MCIIKNKEILNYLFEKANIYTAIWIIMFQCWWNSFIKNNIGHHISLIESRELLEKVVHFILVLNSLSYRILKLSHGVMQESMKHQKN